MFVAPFDALAQKIDKVYRIGVLDTVPATANAANLNAFRHGLKERGYVEGKHFVIEYRSPAGRPNAFPALASELIAMKVDLILTRGTAAVTAAKNAPARFQS